MSLKPGDVTARSEHSGMKNAGEMGSECQICARPVGVRFFYDDPLNTPITDLEVKLSDMSGGTLVEGLTTEAPVSRGLQDATSGVGALRSDLGGVTHGEVPFSAGSATAITNASQDIESAADDAWELEETIVGKLWDFEQAMIPLFRPYVVAWQANGVLSIPAAYRNGVIKGATTWWEGEVGFWGSAWSVLKSSVAAVGGYIEDANRNGIVPRYLPNGTAINTLWKIGGGIADGAANLFSGVNIQDFLQPLTDLMRSFLYGDIDGIISGLRKLTGLEKLEGAIGEFGKMLSEALADSIDMMRDMVEVIRRTPVLGLISSAFMRVLMMMTPNFWAAVYGEGVGFIAPELIIWAITSIIAALSVGSTSGILAARCLRIATSIRKAINGSEAVSKLMRVMDNLAEIISKIKDLGKKLRKSIAEKVDGLIDETQRKFLPARIWKQRLENLRYHGPGSHGVQRHEGEVKASQLDERCMFGKDPMTGTTVDGVHGGKHGYGRDATKLKTPVDFVRAYEKALKTPSIKAAIDNGEPVIRELVTINKLLGDKWRARIMGRSRTGTRANPVSAADTVFPDNTEMFVMLKTRADGSYYLYTMYPKIP